MVLLQFASGSKSIIKSYVDSDSRKVVFSSVLGLGKFINSVLIFVGIVAVSGELLDTWTERNCLFWFCIYEQVNVGFTGPVIHNIIASFIHI